MRDALRPTPKKTPNPAPANTTNVRFEDCDMSIKSSVQVDSNSKISDLKTSIIRKIQTVCEERKQGKISHWPRPFANCHDYLRISGRREVIPGN